jgi:hypothetical protein
LSYDIFTTRQRLFIIYFMPVVYFNRGLLLFSHCLYNEVYEAFNVKHIGALIFIYETANQRGTQGVRVI